MPYVNRAGVRLHYRTAGGHGPAVLLHNGGGGDGQMWELAGYPAALADYQIVLLDHRGHGGSSKPAELAAHRMAEYVNDVIAVVDAAGLQRCALVGYSAGAQVALATAAAYPARITAVAGIGAVGGPEEDSSAGIDAAASVRASGMRAAMAAYNAQEPQPAPRWMLDNLAATPTEMFALLLEAWASEPTAWADMPNVSCPALIICGEREEPGAGRHAAEAARLLPHGHSVVLPGLAHLQAFWRTDLTLPPLTAFLREHLSTTVT